MTLQCWGGVKGTELNSWFSMDIMKSRYRKVERCTVVHVCAHMYPYSTDVRGCIYLQRYPCSVHRTQEHQHTHKMQILTFKCYYFIETKKIWDKKRIKGVSKEMNLQSFKISDQGSCHWPNVRQFKPQINNNCDDDFVAYQITLKSQRTY